MNAPRDDEPVVVGLVAGGGHPAELAAELAEELPLELTERFPGVDWRVEVVETDPHDPAASSGELVETLRRLLLERGWEVAVGLTDLPLRAGRRPVSAHASATHGVGLVSLPALGAVNRSRRLRTAVARVIEGLLGESVRRGGDEEHPARGGRMNERLRDLATPLGRVRSLDDGTFRFVSATVRGNLRLLEGMVRANRPSRVIAGLSFSLVGALGAGALALVDSDVWLLSDHMSWLRLLLVGLASIAATVAALIFAHGLWERADDARARERVVLFNVATVTTLVLAALVLYAVLFAITLAVALVLISSDLLEAAVAHHTGRLEHQFGLADYAKLAWLVASLATIGGALGSLIESDLDVREATFVNRADARAESGRKADGEAAAAGTPARRRSRRDRRRSADRAAGRQ